MVSLLGLMLWYFWPSLHGAQQGNRIVFVRLAIAALGIVILQAVLRMVIASLTPKAERTPPDEREKMIEAKSRQFSYVILAWCVRIVLFVGIVNPTLFFNANTLLFFLVISEILGFGYQIVQFRLGA